MLPFNLYLITDRTLTVYGLTDAVTAALNAGVRAVQLRERDLSIRELVTLAHTLRKITKKFDALLFINDRVDVALCTGADGVHLGANSIPIKAVRKLVGDSLYIGASCHSLKDAANAESEGADFITLGPVYETPSKMQYGSPIGLLPIRSAKKSLNIPILAIGGIKLDQITGIKKCGADGIALISGIFGEDDVYGSAKKYLELLK
jgi:thiamine-phosphate pyrophosphorylase